MRHEPPSDCGPQGHLHGIFEKFVIAHANRNLLPVARRYAGFRGLPDVTAEDILAEGLTRALQVWCYRGLNNSVCEFRLAFIYKTMSNVAQEEVRKRDRAGIVTDFQTIPDTPSGVADLDRVILGREALAIVTRALATLNEQDRLIVDLRIADVSHSDIAKQLGLTPNAARTRLTRIRQRLLSAIETQSGGYSSEGSI
jgi:RNA polymerase sigma factor (sigma-70 family)